MASPVAHVRAAIGLSREEHLSLLAASLAYYAFVSVVPTLLLAVALGSLLGGEAFTARLLESAADYLTPAGERVVERVVTNAAMNTGLGLLGAVALLWGSLRVFRGLTVAFAELYDDDPAVGVLEQVRDGAIVAVAVVLAGATLVSVEFALDGSPLLAAETGVLLPTVTVVLVGLAVTFLPLYYVLPPGDVSVRTVLPGTVLAAVGWFCLRALFGAYVARAEQYAVLGVLGAVFLFLTWLYLASVVLLSGAALNATLDGRGV